uniref:Uncharacterized protein n=1 Tax=Arundo donax TaxID=35708 RepID=A0A0A8XX16_ARUDO
MLILHRENTSTLCTELRSQRPCNEQIVVSYTVLNNG